MLRSHTSAPGDVVLSVPGVCYRRDVIDRHHVGEPHQMDVWRIRRGGPPLGEDDLGEMLGVVVAAVLPTHGWRTAPSEHPYTLAGREFLFGPTMPSLRSVSVGLAIQRCCAPAACLPRRPGWRWGSGSTGSPC